MKNAVHFTMLITGFWASVSLAGAAWALDLHSARASGQVAEQPSGYVAVVKSSPEVDALAADVNAKRKSEYERIAKEKSTSADEVAKLAAQELMKK